MLESFKGCGGTGFQCRLDGGEGHAVDLADTRGTCSIWDHIVAVYEEDVQDLGDSLLTQINDRLYVLLCCLLQRLYND